MKVERSGEEMNNKIKGFTLIEMIVILAILAIILGGTVAGIINYQKYAMYKKNNEYAQSIFVAAQATLTHYRASGELEDLEEELEKMSQEKPKECGKVSDLSLSEQQMQDMYLEQDEEKRLYYLVIQRGHYEGSDYVGYTDEKHPLYRLLTNNIYDDTIAPASICVEFDPVDGVVKAVCYSDRTDQFTYQGSEGTVWKDGDTRIMNIVKRDENTRRDIIMGYYGAGMAEQAPSGRTNPEISRVRLENGETLELTWKMKEEKQLITSFMYIVEIYQEGEKEAKLAFTVNADVDKVGANSATGGTPGFENYLNIINEGDTVEKAHSNRIICPVTFYDGTGNPVGSKTNFEFVAFADSQGEAHLILDAIDLSKEGLRTDGSNWYSINRWAGKLDLTKKIQVKMKAVRNQDKSKGKRASNKEDTMFASRKDGTGGLGTIYELENARHLYNIRFVEGKDSNSQYIQKNDIIWGGTDGIIAHANVFYTDTKDIKKVSGAGWNWNDWNADTMQKISEKLESGDAELLSKLGNMSYPALDVLYKGSSYEAKEGHTIRNLITTARNPEKLSEEEKNKIGVGMVSVNQGKISNITVQNPYINGRYKDAQGHIKSFHAGAVCGINAGELTDISVTDGFIDGEENVGGVVGKSGITDEEKDVVQFNNLTNSATVQGSNSVGGICGAAENVKSIQNCKNTGILLTKDAQGTKSKYIGGIIGWYNYQNSKIATDIGEISGCENNIPVKLKTPGEFLSTESQKLVSGQYKGGILGAGQNVKITNCTTSGGMILGESFVGGIAGYHIIQNEDGIENCTNKANIIARNFAGGIVGVNGKGSYDGSEIQFDITDAKVPDLGKVKISNSINEGIVIASDKITGDKESGYAGGIAGYNGGTLEECSSDTSSTGSTELQKLVTEWGEDAIYVGGLVGFNDGNVTAKEKSVITVVSGKSYVGGIIGWNNDGSTVSGYTLNGGYIQGQNFVGGFIGLNNSAELFLQADGTVPMMESRPNQVTGTKFVGGVIGANIVISNSSGKKELKVNCKTNNFLGTIISKNGKYVGGFIGYNCLGQWKTGEADKNKKTIALAQELAGKNDADQVINAAMNKNIFQETDQLTLTISGIGKGDTTSSNQLSKIEAGAYVGGVIGYNDTHAHLTVEGIVNKTVVEATTAERGNHTELISTDSKAPYLYSYVGGIIGMTTQYVTLDNCSNAENGEAVGKGTFEGGLVEVNYGTIQNCKVGSLGNMGTDKYIGGIAGVNAKKDGVEGKITGCQLETGITVMGKDCLGGLAAINDGTIDGKFWINGTIWGNGINIGGAAGVNRGIITNGTLGAQAEVQGNGTNVGGFAGICEQNSSLEDLTMDPSGTSKVKGSINVGGFAGISREMIQKCINYSEVNATNGNVGGIVGIMEGKTIQNCQNRGRVEASEKGDAGGITADNKESSLIQNCYNTAVISAKGGTAGGITAMNAGTINGCKVAPKINGDGTIDNSGNAVELVTGIGNVGGITAKNFGNKAIIQDTEVVKLKLTNQAVQNNVGGIAGTNEKDSKILSCTVASSVITASSELVSTQCNLGGITGINQGLIQGKNESDSSAKPTFLGVSDVRIELERDLQGCLGGVSGRNYGTIEKYNYSGTIQGNIGSSQCGYGGIVGNNEERGKIFQCYLTGYTTITVGKNVDTNNSIVLGGIAGINQYEATIEECILSKYKDDVCNIGSDNIKGNVGGVAGSNFGEIKRCIHTNTPGIENGEIAIASARPTEITPKVTIGNHEEKAQGTVNITGYNGYIGGITGTNQITGKIENCSNGKRWRLKGNNSVQVGGIIGLNQSRENLSNLVNYASVEAKGWLLSGIIATQNNGSSKQWVFSKCINYGDVTCWNWGVGCAAGIIGNWVGNGGILRECINAGKITAKGDAGGAGMVGHMWGLSPYHELKIDSCENYGDIIITGKTNSNHAGAGGLIAGANLDPSPGVEIEITDCINTGYIDATLWNNFNDAASRTSNIGGIMAAGSNSGKNNYGAITIVRCRNYGFGADGKLSGIKGGKDQKSTKITITDCIGVAGCGSPISIENPNNFDTGRNLYFADQLYGKETEYVLMAKQSMGETTWTAKNNKGTIAIDQLPCNPAKKNKNNRYTMKEVSAFESAIIGYYQKKDKVDPLAAPKNFKVTREGAYFRLSWDSALGIRQYEIRAEIYKDAEGKQKLGEIAPFTVSDNNANILVEEQYAGKYIRFYVRTKKENSIEAQSNILYVQETVATPEFHIEVASENGTAVYKTILDNKDKYKPETAITIKIISAEDELERKNIPPNFDIPSFSINKSTYTKKLSVQAEYNGIKSDLYSQSIYFFTSAEVYKGRLFQANKKLTGLTADTLACEITLSKGAVQNESSINLCAELLAYDADIGGTVAAASDIAGYGEKVSFSLAEIYKNNKNVTIRVYPYSSPEGVVRYANVIKEGVNVSEVKSSIYWDSNAKKAKTGYSIQRRADGLYNIIRSVHLQSGSTNAPFIYVEESFSLPGINDDAPVIEDVIEQNGNYIFSWDQKNGKKGPYWVSLTGTKPDGSKVQLKVNEVFDSGEKQFEYSVDDWNYTNATLQVTREGQKNGDGSTSSLGGTASKELHFKLPLSTIARPTITLKDGNKDDLIYTIMWGTLTDPGQLGDLDHYQVTITKEDGTLWRTIPTTNKETYSAEVDLEELSGENIKISVKAIARSDARNYKNSKSGVARDFAVPSRMPISADGLKLLPEGNNAILRENYTNAFTLSMENSETTIGGRYAFEARIYDGVDEAGKPQGDQLLNLSSDGRITMEGSLQKASYAFKNIGGISPDYAGKYLAVRIRIISDSNISSNWSEYRTFQLPKAKLDQPKLSSSYKEQICEVAIKGNTTDVREVQILNDTIKWAETLYTDQYRLVIQPLAEEEEQNPVSVIIKKVSDGNYQAEVEVTGKDGNKITQSYELSGDKPCTLEEYSQTVVIKEDGVTYTTVLKAQLEYLPEEKAFRLILPDNGVASEDVDYLLGKPRLITRSVTIQSHSDKEDQYEDSVVREWLRVRRILNQQEEISIRMINQGDTLADGWEVLKNKVGIDYIKEAGTEKTTEGTKETEKMTSAEAVTEAKSTQG